MGKCAHGEPREMCLPCETIELRQRVARAEERERVLLKKAADIAWDALCGDGFCVASDCPGTQVFNAINALRATSNTEGTGGAEK